MNAGKASMIPLAFTDMRIHTGEKSMNVGKPSNFPLFYIRELIQRNKSYGCFISISKAIYLKNTIRFPFQERWNKHIPLLPSH